MNKFVFFTATFLLSAAIAAEPNKPAVKADFLKTVDKNADGKASKEEFFAAMEKKFQSMDVDKSDVVSLEELRIYGVKERLDKKQLEDSPKKIENKIQLVEKKHDERTFNEKTFTYLFIERAEREFSTLDIDHDNQLSADELGVTKAQQERNRKAKKQVEKMTKAEFVALFTEPAEDKFILLDTNYDGRLTPDELETLESNSEYSPATAAVSSFSSPEPQAAKKVTEMQKLIKFFFVGIDLNNDGQITNPEKNAAFTRLFNRLDTNHDQFITQDEIAAGHHAPATDTP